MGPSKMQRQERLNFLNSSKRLSGCFHLGATGGVMFAKLKELYSLTIWKFTGLAGFNGGAPCGGCMPTGFTGVPYGGCPPTAPCSCICPS